MNLPVATQSTNDAAATVAAVTNLNSRQNVRSAAARTSLARLPACEHFETASAEELEAAVRKIVHDPCEVLVINGGDGTVQNVLSALAVKMPIETLPIIALLPGGTTNMTAHDVNGRRLSPAKALMGLESLLQGPIKGPDPVPTRQRYVLEVQRDDEPARYGFFFGLGAILNGIEYTHKTVYRAGVAGEEASGIALLRSVWGIARGESAFTGATPIRVRGTRQRHDGNVTLLLTSTLERLLLGFRPYWGPRLGPLKSTLVQHPPYRMLRNLPALLRGRPDQRMNAATGYHSWYDDELVIERCERFTIDGELFDCHGQRLCIRAAGPLRFLPLASVFGQARG